MGYFAEKNDELQHHGIRGQKWGVRRFQNKDGTLTPAGRRHYDEDSDDAQNGGSKKGISIDKDKVKKAALITAGVAAGAFLIANPTTRNALAKYGKTAINNIPNAGAKIGGAVGKGAAKLANRAEKRLDKVGDAMVDAALLSVGGIAISKVTEKLAVGEDASEAEKNRSKVMTDVATAAIKTATGVGGESGSSSKGTKGGSVGKEVSDKIGAPSKKSIDKQSAEWQALFKDANGNQRDADTRATIKSLASAGYDIDQIDKYLNHSFNDWASQYMAVEIGW